MNNDTAIKIKSPLLVWYLTSFRGLKVRAVYCAPVIPLLHMILYSRTWVLVPV